MKSQTYHAMGVEAKAAYHVSRALLFLSLNLPNLAEPEARAAAEFCGPNRYPDLFAEALAVQLECQHERAHR